MVLSFLYPMVAEKCSAQLRKQVRSSSFLFYFIVFTLFHFILSVKETWETMYQCWTAGYICGGTCKFKDSILYHPVSETWRILTISLVGRGKTLPPPQNRDICPRYGTKLIWLRGFNSGDLKSIEYPFIAITTRSTQTRINICLIPIYGSNILAWKLFVFD